MVLLWQLQVVFLCTCAVYLSLTSAPPHCNTNMCSCDPEALQLMLSGGILPTNHYTYIHTLSLSHMIVYATDETDHTGALGESLTEAILSHDVIAALPVYGCY